MTHAIVNDPFFGTLRRRTGTRGRPAVMLEGIDFSLPDAVNAEKYGCSAGTIRKKRLEAGVKLIRGRRHNPNPIYDTLDWTLQDTVLAKQVGVSRERIRQVRRKRGEADAARHGCYTDRPSKAPAILAMLREGKSRKAIARKMKVSVIYVMCVGYQNGFKWRSYVRPWDDMDWSLPNMMLERIWKLKPPPSQHVGFRIGSKRHHCGFPSPRWDMRYEGVERDAEYRRAVKAEQAKAAKWFEGRKG